MEEYQREAILEPLSFEGKQMGEIWDLSDFKFEDDLPSGLSGKLNISTEIISQKRCVIKEIPIGDYEYNNETAIQTEISILKKLYSSYIIKLYGYFVKNCNYYLVFEYGGIDLLEYMMKYGKIESVKIKKIFGQMLEAVNECHKNGIMHRDIKPENFVYNIETGTIKLIDFGFATTEKTSNKKIGTPLYFSPEVNSIKFDKTVYYTKCIDIWSLGCIFYIFLHGKPSFNITKLKTHQLPYVLKNIRCKLIGHSDNEIDILFKMLEIVPYKRATTEELLQHSYFKV